MLVLMTGQVSPQLDGTNLEQSHEDTGALKTFCSYRVCLSRCMSVYFGMASSELTAESQVWHVSASKSVRLMFHTVQREFWDFTGLLAHCNRTSCCPTWYKISSAISRRSQRSWSMVVFRTKKWNAQHNLNKSVKCWSGNSKHSYTYTIAGRMPSVCSSSLVLTLERYQLVSTFQRNHCHSFSGTNALIMLLSCVSMDNSLPLFSPMSLILKIYPLKIGQSPGQPYAFPSAPHFVTCSSMPQGLCTLQNRKSITYLVWSKHFINGQDEWICSFRTQRSRQIRAMNKAWKKWGANPSKQNSWEWSPPCPALTACNFLIDV